MKEKLQKRFKDLQKKDKKGFTLIELIVVLVILGIILAITVPAVTSYIDEAKNAKYLAQAHSVFVIAEVESAKVDAGLGVAGDLLKTEEIQAKLGNDIKVSDFVGGAGGPYTFAIEDDDGSLIYFEATSNEQIKEVPAPVKP